MPRHLQKILAAMLVAVVCGYGCVAIISSDDGCRDDYDDDCSDCHGGVVVVVESKSAPQDSVGGSIEAVDPGPGASVTP